MASGHRSKRFVFDEEFRAPGEEALRRRALKAKRGKRTVEPRDARKRLQLCGQVARTLAQVLAEEDDDVLRDLDVVSAEPCADGGRIIVTVAPFAAVLETGLDREYAERFDPVTILERLASASGRLRSEVAASITRRRAPHLSFRVAYEAKTRD